MSIVLPPIPIEALKEFRANFKTYVERAINTAIYRAQEAAKRMVPVRKRTWEGGGGLRDSLRISTIGNTVKIQFLAPYAKIAEEGARPHIIRAKKGSTLHWENPAGMHHFADSVRHPGYAGLEFVEPIKNFIIQLIKEQIGFAMHELAARGL